MNYRVESLHPIRRLVAEQMTIARKRNTIHGLFELDISLLKEKISEHRKNGHVFSFSAYIMFCFGKALEAHRELLDMRWGKKKKVSFEQVDLFTIVERREKGQKSVPVGLIIRNLGGKSLDEINTELRSAQKADPLSLEGVAARRRIMNYPGFIRRIVLWYIHKNPVLFVKHYGNAGVSSLHFFSDKRSWFGIPLIAVPVCLMPAGTYKKLIMIDGQTVEREFTSFTLSLNHDLNDGSPGVRFAKDFADKVENAFGL